MHAKCLSSTLLLQHIRVRTDEEAKDSFDSKALLAYLQIKLGDWYDEAGKDRKIATQYHEVMGDVTYKWLGRFSRLVIIIALGGDALAQIIASSSNFHTFIPSVNKR